MSRLFQSFTRPPAAMPLPTSALPTRRDEAAEDPNGPGWYESSRDLRCGLVIRELVGIDAAWAEVERGDAPVPC